MAATGNASFGYFVEVKSSTISTVDRVDYSNDTATATTKGPLSAIDDQWQDQVLGRWTSTTQAGIVNYAAGTLSTFNTGYFGGGSPGNKSTIERIDYSNDTATATTKGLYVGRNQLAAVSSGSHGYFTGGLVPRQSTVQRVDYFNDTATAVVKGPLSQTVYRHAGTDTKDFGYLAAGENPSYLLVNYHPWIVLIILMTPQR